MIEIIIILAVLALITPMIKQCCKSRSNCDWYIPDITIICLVAIVVLVGLNVCFQSKYTEINRITNNLPIYSLKNNNSIEGYFSLGSGYVNGIENYLIFYKDNAGGFKRLTLPVYSCILYQDIDIEKQNSYISWQDVTYITPNWLMIWPKINYKSKTYYDIHVPTNTIIEQFKVD